MKRDKPAKEEIDTPGKRQGVHITKGEASNKNFTEQVAKGKVYFLRQCRQAWARAHNNRTVLRAACAVDLSTVHPLQIVECVLGLI